MKNIVISFLMGISCGVYAKDLQCVDWYKTFESLEAESIKILKSGSLEELKIQSEKDEAVVKFGLRAERICLKDVTDLFAPVRFQNFDE